MPEYALRVFSQSSDILTEKISAFDIRSHEDAREKGPFCDFNHELMYWKNWGKRKNGGIIKKHFAHYGDRRRPLKNFNKIVEEQIQLSVKSREKSSHKKFQSILLEIITKKIESNSKISWFFKDKESSDFFLKGDLLANAVKAQKEYRIKPPFVNYYDLDIAVLGKDEEGNDIVLAGIEIEYSHKAELLKTLLCKSLGFPLFTINIENVHVDEIDEKMCIKLLTETTISSADKKRRNYIYLHPLLYPVFLTGYNNWGVEINEKHQYIIFPRRHEVDILRNEINSLIMRHKLSQKDTNCSPVKLNPNVQSSVTQFQNETSIFANYIKDYSQDLFIRLQSTRPVEPEGTLFKFHLELAQILALDYDCLVSYKYAKGRSNWNHDEQFWYLEKYTPPNKKWEKGTFEKKKLCFKRLSVPIRLIMKFLPQI